MLRPRLTNGAGRAVWAASVFALVAAFAPSPVIRAAQAQASRPSAPQPRSPELVERDQYLTILQRLRSGCENAAWSLWHSNSYDGWRKRRSSGLAMNYSSSFYPSVPAPPTALPDPLKGQLNEALVRANDSLRQAGADFKELANYVNARDYEDDSFKKGDALNAKLVAVGTECHALHGRLTDLFVELAEHAIGREGGAAARPAVVAALTADWRRARELSRELAKGPAADPQRLDTLVRDVSTLAEERRREFGPAFEGGGTLARFYDRILNEDVAVKMRKLLREGRQNPKALSEAAIDRPRSGFRIVRSEIDYAMPDAILHFMRHGT